jgi:redox-sensitive bicupin YhaK (pirin superfamily)
MSQSQLALLPIRAIVAMPYHAFDAHSGAHMLRVDYSWIDPFIGVDSYTMPQPFFGPHPHAGMSAVSLMLPEADGGFVNRDSLGDHSIIRPGDLHWTQAGRGMMHEEVPAEPGKAARGLQIFVNLSRQHKQADPVAFKVKHEDMPLVPIAGGSVRVVAGEFAGQRSPIAGDPRWLTRVSLLDVTLAAGSHVDLPVTAGDNAFFVIRSGNAADPSGQSVSQSAIVFAASTEHGVARISAATNPIDGQVLRGVFFSGTPINEPIYPGGPFTGNTEADILAYKRAFAAGEMGRLAASFSR